MKAKRRKGRPARPDMDETKTHILTAGRELMLAAQGALAFCRDYAKASAAASSRSQLMNFFSKATEVADELAKGLVTATRMPGAARQAAGHIFDAIEKEMEEEARETARPCGKPPAKKYPAREIKGKARRKPAGGRPCRKGIRK